MNKQSILSLKKCALSLGIAAMAAGFTACSEKDMPNGPEAPDQEVSETTVGSPVNVINDPSELDKYVTNYKRPGSRGSRAILERGDAPTFDMPDLAEFTATVELDDETCYDEWGTLKVNINDAGVYVVPEGKTFTAPWGLNFNGNNGSNVQLIVYGTLKVDKQFGLNGRPESNIYVAPTGKLVLGTDNNNNPLSFLTEGHRSLYIYDGATIEGGSLNTSNGASLYVEGDLFIPSAQTEEEPGDVEFGGIVRIGGQLTAGNLTTNNAKLYAHDIVAETWTYMNDSKVVAQNIQIAGDVEIKAQNEIDCKNYIVGGDFHMENNSVLYAHEHLGVGGNAEISTQGLVYTPCLYVEKELFAKNCANIIVPNYIRCDGFQADASGFNISMDGNALINAHSHFTVLNKKWTIAFDNTADTPSAIVADKFEIMEGEAAYISGYAFLSAKEGNDCGYWGKPDENTQYYVEGDYKNYNIVGDNVKVTFGGVTVKSKDDDCTPDFTTPNTPTPPTITELISSIKHTHDISATCVAINNGKAYFSWHKRGTSIHGCLEAGKVENDTLSLTSWMEVNDGNTEGDNNWDGNSAVSGADEAGEKQGDFDFNHLIVAEGQVVTVGDNAKKGGFIGAIALDDNGDFGMNGSLQNAFRSRQLLAKKKEVGRSGNCVLYNNDKYYIACAGGFQEYTVTNTEEHTGSINDLFVWKEYQNPSSESATGYWAANLGAYELTAGSAKHIAINPDGDKIATLELTAKGTHPDGDDYWFNDTKTAISAVLKVRDANDWLNDTKWEANIGLICPIYGKNAIAMDNDGNVYVAAGRQGLLVYNNGNKVGEFNIRKEVEDAGANGLAIDEKYVYVAYGIGGLWILNKNDLSVVSWYKSNAPEGYKTEAAAASANYVAVDGKYIYVAYGRHGVKVLKLND